jgi:alpha-D-ribose 1-methylphosphonate 5-triphosphate synthase subunit PhnH
MTFAQGFSDPIREQQRTFRAVMDALSRPSTPVPYSNPIEQAGPLQANAYAIALTLLDFEVSYHLAPSLAAAEPHLTFQTGSRRVEDAAKAQFAFVDLHHDRLDLATYAQGEPDYPDRSTTIIALCHPNADSEKLVCRGPGISAAGTLDVPGLPEDFLDQWKANSSKAPLGVDLLFVSAEVVIGLPRSTRVFGESC